MIYHRHVPMLVKLALHHEDPITRAEAAMHLIKMDLPVSDQAMVIAARRDQEELRRNATAEADAVRGKHRRDVVAELLKAVV
jgi:hypothetical protein